MTHTGAGLAGAGRPRPTLTSSPPRSFWQGRILCSGRERTPWAFRPVGLTACASN